MVDETYKKKKSIFVPSPRQNFKVPVAVEWANFLLIYWMVNGHLTALDVLFSLLLFLSCLLESRYGIWREVKSFLIKLISYGIESIKHNPLRLQAQPKKGNMNCFWSVWSGAEILIYFFF